MKEPLTVTPTDGYDVTISRRWAMPDRWTFSVPPIGEFVRRYLKKSSISIDPFAGNNPWATYCNDIDPKTSAGHHMDAVEFLEAFRADLAGQVDLAIIDPPYSPRQLQESYGKKSGRQATQNGALYKRVRDALMPLLTPSAIVLSFGWNSAGMGSERGFRRIEIVLVNHGGAHNDTICVAERRA